MIRAETKQDAVFLQHLEDLKDRCVSRYTTEFTGFLDGRLLSIAKQYLASFADDVIAVSFGGFHEAERLVIGIFPKELYAFDGFEESQLLDSFELKAVIIEGSGFSSFSHRDVMGSVLGLGIKRETLGDIFVTDDGQKAYICLDKVACEYIAANLDFVARDKVKVKIIDVGNLPAIKKKFSVISGTVASERLDCIISLITNISREKAKMMITQGLVSINHFEETRCDTNLCEEDIISVRGFGRFVVKEFGGVTRKGRNRVVVHKMI